VLFLEGLSEAELQWCYARCEALAVPSQTEGFGLPVAEALLVGCRVICSDIPAFREMGGGHCRFVALGVDAEEALAAAIAATLQEPAKEPISLPQLSAKVLASQYASLYRGLISSSASLGSQACKASIQLKTPERQSS
jgi:glycosyltransferase involved in cell wall biosynthesis